MNYRPLRVASLLKDELNAVVNREVELDLGVLATITDVIVDKKLEHAIVKVSILPSDATEKSLGILKKAQPRIQYLLMKKLNIKPLPQVQFVLDEGIENASRVEKLFIESENKENL